VQLPLRRNPFTFVPGDGCTGSVENHPGRSDLVVRQVRQPARESLIGVRSIGQQGTN
jgi:hypothetical protein